ncbi:unnamed protein product [Blepharisma stoltei]|uniref:Ubiquitin-like domain-containing protein n=1 Tax=Blepharisma stoltei TaxID=1481888 RepID=A0AAU9JAE8_9CILI|nr:unnamed protein product [Blepharisma stoltei]
MKITLESGTSRLNFDPFTIEIEPNYDVEYILSLLSVRYNTLDPKRLALYLNNRPLQEDLNVMRVGIKDNDHLIVKIKKSSCCSCCLLL